MYSALTKPTFLIIGAGKCGTSSLAAYLQQHPSIFITEPKEPGYFSENYHRGAQWYADLFAGSGRSIAAWGEATVNYSKAHEYPQAAARIVHDLPSVQLLYIVRNPLERIVSEWRYRVLKYEEKRPFPEAIRQCDDYVKTSDYGWQLSFFMSHFSREQMAVVFLEDLKTNAPDTLRRCCEFLGLSPIAEWDLSRRNVGSEAVGTVPWVLKIGRESGRVRYWIPQSLRRRVRGWFGRRAEDVPLLQQPLGWDEELHQYILSQLGDSSRRFLRDWGKREDFWDLGQPLQPSLDSRIR